MKKLYALLLAALLLVSLCACADNTEAPVVETQVTTVEPETPVAQTPAEPAPAAQPEPPAAPAEEPAPAEPVAIDLAAVQQAIIEELDITEYSQMEAPLLLNLYGLQEADMAQFACFTTMAAVFPNEVILVEAVDEAAAVRMAELLGNRLKEVRNQSASYDPENYALAQECTVDTDGLIVSMFISPDHAAMRTVLETYLTGK